MKDENDDIKRYHAGLLTESERHALEKKALTDPFLAEALEGGEQINPEEFAKDLDDISRKVKQRSAKHIFTPLRIAAGIIFAVSVSFIVYLMNVDNSSLLESKEMASEGVESSDSMTVVKPEEKKPEEIALSAPKKSTTPTTGPLASKSRQEKPVIVQSETKGDVKLDEPVLEEAEEKKADVKIAEEKNVEEQKQPVVLTEDVAANKKETDRKDGDVSALVSPSQTGGGALRSKQAVADTKAKDKSGNTITGRVTWAEDGSPLAGVNIVVKGMVIGTITDNKGNYSLHLPGSQHTLTFSFIGMKTVEADPAGKTTLDISMDEQPIVAQEAVVVSASRLSRDDYSPVTKLAQPVGGIKAYNQYLEKNKRFPAEAFSRKIKGKVMIQFVVKSDGALSEFTVLKSLGYGCDEEVMRLVKEGPQWTPSTVDDLPVESEVKVRLKFDPDKAGK